MSITVPTVYPTLDSNALLGHVPAGQEPLHTLLKRTNWAYAEGYTPALVSFCPVASKQTSSDYRVAVVPSADALDYTFRIKVWAQSGVSSTLTISEASSSSSGTYTAISTTTPSLSTGLNTLNISGATVSASTRYLKVTLTTSSTNHQIHHVLAFPKVLTSLTAGITSSGFIPYEDSHLTSTGAAIHTEYLNRCWANIEHLRSDRRHTLTSYVQDWTSPKYTYGRSGAMGADQSVERLFYGAVHLPKSPMTVTVRMRANDTGSGGRIVVGQVNGNAVTLDADDTDNTASLVLTGPTPILYGLSEPDADLTIRYVEVDTNDVTTGTATIISEAAPPARLEYLQVLDMVSREALTRWPVSLVNFNPALSSVSGGDWYWAHRLPFGVVGGQAMVTRSLDGAPDVTAPDTSLWGASSGATANDEILIPAGMSGTFAYPLAAGSMVVYGSKTNEASPTAPMNRLLELDTSTVAVPAVEEFYGDELVGMSLVPVPAAS